MFLWQGTFREFPFQLINCIDVWSGVNTCICFLFFSKAFSGYSLMGRCQGYSDDRDGFNSISTRISSFPFVQPFILMEHSLHQTYYRLFLPFPQLWRVLYILEMVIAGKNRPTALNQKSLAFERSEGPRCLERLQANLQVPKACDVSFHHMQWLHQWHHLMHIDACPHQPHTKGRNPDNYPTQSSFVSQNHGDFLGDDLEFQAGYPKSWTLLEVEHQYPKHQDWPTLFEQTWFYNSFLGNLRDVTGLEITVKGFLMGSFLPRKNTASRL